MILLIDGFDEYVITPSLLESKSFSSFRGDDEIRQALVNYGFARNKEHFKKERRAQSSRSQEKFNEIRDRILDAMIRYTNEFKNGEISKRRWQDWVRHLLRESYREAYKAGFQSSGVGTLQVGTTEFDEKWVNTASRHEMKYFNKLLDEIAEGRQSGSIEKRLSNYTKALKNVYFSGRVMGTPSNHLIDWVGPQDRKTCVSCRFLAKHSPYTKDTLPTTPRAGDTRCLMNCRDKLIVREVKPELFEKIQMGHRSKSWYQDKLSRIKAGKTL